MAWYDTSRDGLSHSHPVGIWKDTTGLTEWPYINGGTLITSAMIPAGVTAELSGPWRRVPIAPLVLDVGGYSIGGQNNSQSVDDMVYLANPGPSVVDPHVILGAFDYNIGGLDGFHPPGTPPSGWYLYWGAELGPMLFLEPVPEPGAAQLLAIACGILFSLRLRLLRKD